MAGHPAGDMEVLGVGGALSEVWRARQQCESRGGTRGGVLGRSRGQCLQKKAVHSVVVNPSSSFPSSCLTFSR